MKRYSVLLTKSAQKDIQNTVLYIKRDLFNQRAALSLAKKLRNRIQSLELMPKKHSLVRDETLAHQGIRWLKVDNYLIFYIINDSSDTVSILRVLYGRRNWESLI